MSRRTVVVDFDGTVTQQDLLDTIASRFGDPEVYREVDEGLDEGRLTLREVITREYEPVRRPLEEIVAWELENVSIRPGFRELVELAKAEGWRFVIVSSGFHELIEPILEHEGLELEVRANDVEWHPDGWRGTFRNGDACGTCGEPCKRADVPGHREGQVVYVGDGYSDRCAAQAADRIFARDGLAWYLDERGVAYERFEDFHDVSRALAA